MKKMSELFKEYYRSFEGSPASMAGMKTGRKEKLPQRAGDGGSPVQASLAGNPSELRPEQKESVGKP